MDNRNLYILIAVLAIVLIAAAIWFFVISPFIINTGPGKQVVGVYNRSGGAVYNNRYGDGRGGSYNQPTLNIVQPGSTPSYINPGNNHVSGRQSWFGGGILPLGDTSNLPYLNINQPGSNPSYIIPN
uniref:Uncharacterized protein n=1 Tax=viral metagenome TaxID=1070528 RepID=A0A6C0JU44_9ZZZZ